MLRCDSEKHWVSLFRRLHRRANCFELGYRVEVSRSRAGPPLPNLLVRLKRWLAAHHMTLMAIADTPHSIALGSAIGIFFGFTPLWSMKTLLSIAVAWVFKSNKIAAAIAVTLHDIILPLMPAVYFWQYRIGMRVLHARQEHRAAFHQLSLHDFMTWPPFD